MSTKKVILIIVGILSVLALIVALFVGAIAGFVFYTIGKSEAAQTAKTFLKNNEKLKRDIGAVKDTGSIITGSIKERNSAGDATLYIKVIGERRTVNATVDLIYRRSDSWQVVDASYEDESGKKIELIHTERDDSP